MGTPKKKQRFARPQPEVKTKTWWSALLFHKDDTEAVHPRFVVRNTISTLEIQGWISGNYCVMLKRKQFEDV